MFVFENPRKLTAALSVLLWAMADLTEDRDLLDEIRAPPGGAHAWHRGDTRSGIATTLFLRPDRGGAVYHAQPTAFDRDRDPKLARAADGRTMNYVGVWKRYRPVLRLMTYHALTRPFGAPAPSTGWAPQDGAADDSMAECGHFRVAGSRVACRREELIYMPRSAMSPMGTFHLYRSEPLACGQMMRYAPTERNESPLVRLGRLYKEQARSRYDKILLGDREKGVEKVGRIAYMRKHFPQLWLDMQLQSHGGARVAGAIQCFSGKPWTKPTALYHLKRETVFHQGLGLQKGLTETWGTEVEHVGVGRYRRPVPTSGRGLFDRLLSVWQDILDRVTSHPRLAGEHIRLSVSGEKFHPIVKVEAWMVPEEELGGYNTQAQSGREVHRGFNLSRWSKEHHSELTARWEVHLGKSTKTGAAPIESEPNPTLDPSRITITEDTDLRGPGFGLVGAMGDATPGPCGAAAHADPVAAAEGGDDSSSDE